MSINSKKINIEYNKNIDDSKLKLLFKKLNKKLNYEMYSYYSFNSENDKIKDIFQILVKKLKLEVILQRIKSGTIL